MKHINKVVPGSIVRVLWDMPDEDSPEITHEQWYTGTVEKVHRRDRMYVVCQIAYDDGENEISSILKERDYGTDWFFDGKEGGDSSEEDDGDSDFSEAKQVPDVNVDVLVDNNDLADSMRSMNRVLSTIAFVQCLMVLLSVVSAARQLFDQHGVEFVEFWKQMASMVSRGAL
jgi:hypothetical protein